MFFPGKSKRTKGPCNWLAFSPFYVFSGEGWKENSYFPSLDGGCFELLYRRQKEVYYAGTFKCHQTRDWFPVGVRVPSGIACDSVAEGHIALPFKVYKCRERTLVARMYQNGVLRVDCLVLECVGFNHELYTALRFAEDCNVKKRKVNEEAGGGQRHKRAKT